MDADILIFWFVFFSSVSGLAVALKRFRHGGTGWVVVFGCILLVAVTGLLGRLSAFVYTAAGMWLLLVLGPGLIARFYHRYILQDRYGAARRLAKIIRWLHPADGWREQPEILDALELAQRGELPAALEIVRQGGGQLELKQMYF